MTLTKGDKLGPYEILSPAGAGGMGEVYRARDTRLDRVVAIKVLPTSLVADADARARFSREAKTISSLNHPHICTLHDVGHEAGIDYLVMEFLEGTSLDERIRAGRFDVAEALKIGAQVAGALDAAHRKGLVHRDLKPSNILLTKDGAKLLDFGLAKLQTSVIADFNDKTSTGPVTGAGAIVGTLQYMSPEQLDGREADSRSDIFSFGATLYEMLTGRKAFSGDSKAGLIGSIMKEAPPTLAEHYPASPPALDRLVRKCLAKDPEDRWQSARDLKDELQWVTTVVSQRARADSVSGRSRTWARVGLVLLSAVSLIFSLLWIHADRERAKAVIASERATKGQQFLSDVLTSSFPYGYGDGVTVLDILNRADRKLNAAFSDDPEIEVNLRGSLGNAYRRIGHYQEAEREFTTALSLSEKTFGSTDDRTLMLLDELSSLYRILNDGNALLNIARTHEAAVRQRFGESHKQTLDAKREVAFALERVGSIERAREEAEEAWLGYKNYGADDTASLLDAQIQYAWLMLKAGSFEKSKQMTRAAFDLATLTFGDADPIARSARSTLAAAYIVHGDIDSAKALYNNRQVPDTFGIERVFQGEFDLANSRFQLLVFFETWCPYSRQAMSDLAEVDRQYRQLGVNICGLTRINRSAAEEGVNAYLRELQVGFTVVKENGRSWNYFDCEGTPSIRLIHDGYLIWEKRYYTDDAISTQMLESLVAIQSDSL